MWLLEFHGLSVNRRRIFMDMRGCWPALFGANTWPKQNLSEAGGHCST